jgi:hypothetical protein
MCPGASSVVLGEPFDLEKLRKVLTRFRRWVHTLEFPRPYTLPAYRSCNGRLDILTQLTISFVLRLDEVANCKVCRRVVDKVKSTKQGVN